MKVRTFLIIAIGFLAVSILAVALLNNLPLLEQRFQLTDTHSLPVYGVISGAFILGLSVAVLVSLLQDSRSLLERARSWWGARTRRAIEERYRHGIEALLGGQDERALEAFDEVLARDPGHFDSLMMSGDALRSLKRFEQAIERHRRARRLRPEDIRPLYSLASDYEESKQLARARLVLTKIVELDPRQSISALRRLRKLHMREGDWTGALGFQERIEARVERTPYKLEAERRYGVGIRYQIAVSLSQKGQHRDAIAQFRRVLKASPKFVPALLALGDAQKSAGDPEAAVDTWQEAFRSTGSPIFLTALENHFLGEEDPQVAIDTFQGLIADAGSGVMPRFFLGRLYLRLEMIDEACDELERLKRHVAYSPVLHYLLGKALARRNDFRRAAGEFERALEELDLPRLEYQCAVCGTKHPRWQDRCARCGEWNTVGIDLREERVSEEIGPSPSPVYSA